MPTTHSPSEEPVRKILRFGYDFAREPTFPSISRTSLQRWHRDLLRRAMESEGFTVNEDEWWHFDYKDWKQYGILNVPFEKIAVGAEPKPVSN